MSGGEKQYNVSNRIPNPKLPAKVDQISAELQLKHAQLYAPPPPPLGRHEQLCGYLKA